MIKVKKLNANAILPTRAHEGDAGVDLYLSEDTTIFPGDTVLLPTGLAIAIPFGFEGQIRPRSGVSFKTGLRVCNAPGTIDTSYRGEVKIIMQNTGDTVYTLAQGDRIAQLVIAKVYLPDFEFVEELDDTTRGSGGFGSSGK